MVWPVKTHPAQSTGPEGKKNSGDGENFSLDFSFYRTALPAKWTAGPILAGALVRYSHIPFPTRNALDKSTDRGVTRQSDRRTE